MNVGIIGAGHIAGKIARTLERTEGVNAIAIGSRGQEKAEAFAKEYRIPRAYGSYSALLDDPEIDLVYIATPHSHHFEPTMEAISKGKACLVEKAFMANARETKAVLDQAKEKGVFVAEAIWTRYQPARDIINRLISYGKLGSVRMINATLSHGVMHLPRITRPELCGGTLLDIGLYPLNFVRMVSDNPIEKIESQCVVSDEGVDISETISLTLEGGILATIQSSVCCEGFNTASIAGTKGTIVIDNTNNPQLIRIFAKGGKLVEEITVPESISGYEYEFLACKDAMEKGLIEPPQMPHSETLFLMELMDSLRHQWGVRYPMD